MKVLLDINVVLDVFHAPWKRRLDAIVSRNPKDFATSPVLILTPAELLTLLAKPPMHEPSVEASRRAEGGSRTPEDVAVDLGGG